MASLITFSNFTPTVAIGPIPEEVVIIPETEIVRELSIPEFIELESRKAGIDPNLATKIAFCESTHRQFKEGTDIPLRGIVNSRDVGVFQINERFHLQKSQDLGFDIYTLEGNVGYALWLLGQEGSRHWNASRPCWGRVIENA